MSLRIRQVKPDFWADATLADLPESTRLFYIGLWMTADDAGWLRWDVPTVAADLYRFDPRRSREKKVASMMGVLAAIGRVTVHDCGHAYIPKLVEHQRFSASYKRTRTIEREHLEKCNPAGTRGDPHIPVSLSIGKGSKGKGSLVKVSSGGASAFRDAMSAAGVDPDVVS